MIDRHFRYRCSWPSGGFTLVEFVVVLVILGIVSAVAFIKYSDLRSNASNASLQGVVGAFKVGVHEARAMWILEANGQPAENLQVFGTDQNGQLDFNANGWPSQQWFGALEANPTLNNVADCISLANGILQGSLVISNAADADYTASYLGSNSCRYSNVDDASLSFTYDSNNGVIQRD